MPRRRTRFTTALLALFGLFASAAAQAELKTGDVAPAFELADQNGQPVRLNDFKGQWVVLYFYPKDDTPGCTTEACSFRDNVNRLIQKEAVILGVSLDSVESHRKFAEKHRLPFRLLADPDGRVAKQYDALLDLVVMKFAKRHSFIIDPEGRIGKIYRDVDPQKHVADILKELQTLQTNGT